MRIWKTSQTIVFQRANRRVRAEIITAILSVCVTAWGCSTTLGYIPEHLKPTDRATYVPTYSEVKKWAFDVVDGYDSRATMNRHALYFGALLGVAAAGALAGLAAFDSGNSARTGIPIGTAFLGGVFAIYSSEEKAQIYGYASRYVKDLITASDKRLLEKRSAKDQEAICLRNQINEVMRKVAEHITLLDPKNVGQRLRAVQKQTGNDTVTLTLPPADFSDLNPPRPLRVSCPEE